MASAALENLHNRIDLFNIPFTDRGSRLLLSRKDDELFVRLAERWEKWERQVGHYRLRPPIIENLRLLDAAGTPLALTTDTYPHLVSVNTAVGRFDWIFLDPDSLLIRLPAGRYGFDFVAHSEHGQTDRRGGTLHGKRNTAYTTNARILSNEIKNVSSERDHIRLTVDARDGDALLINITPRMAYNRTLPVPDTAIAEARARWQAWFDAAPPVPRQYQMQYEYAWWVMRIGLLTTRYYFTREACVPSKIHYVGVWHWDQFFHALAYRHVDTRLAEDQIRIVLDHQRENGMLPDAIHDEGLVIHLTRPVDEDVTKPPLAAWTVLKVFEKTGHFDFLDEVYEPLVRWHQWWVKYSSADGGLCEYRHPFSSGLDDSPLWDDGMPVVAPDLNTYLVLQCESLARIAELLNLPDDVAKFRAEADRRVQLMMEQLWDEQHGWFNALHQGKPVPVFTLFSLLPLMTGRLPEAVVNRLVAHLTDPKHFWTRHPLATVASSDLKFDPMQMWRGPVWVNINYLFIEGLRRIGRHDLARKLRRQTLELMMQHADIYEYYNPLNGAIPPKAAPIFGWSSAVFIDLAIQEKENPDYDPRTTTETQEIMRVFGDALDDDEPGD